MIKPIIRDVFSLRQPSTLASKEDRQIICDLQDTLRANADRCVGMAANMIGAHKRILVFSVGPAIVTMVNPTILHRSDVYEAEEGCLSLSGTRRTQRYGSIDVEFLDENFRPRRQAFTGFIAQIIQHEMDHFEGILI